jgi:hypothetical protein
VANVDAYALQRSDLNGFLFAEIGVEAGGMTLSVLSTLARLGTDPWQEASHLAKLPQADAVERLARIIAAMPASPWSPLAATTIAARLVPLLPARRGGPSIAPPTRPADAPSMTTRLMARLPAPGGPSTRLARTPFWTTKQWAVVLALLAAVLVGLTVNLTGQRGTSSDSDVMVRGTTSSMTSPAAAPSSDHVPSGEQP